MPLVLATLLFQTKARIDPRIAQGWTAAVATGLRSAVLDLRPDGRFSIRYVESSGRRGSFQGTYAVAPMTQAKPGANRIVLTYDLESLRKGGMAPTELAALRKKGRKGAPGLSLVFDPEVPVLTDTMTSHFVPVRGKDAALRRLARWRPF